MKSLLVILAVVSAGSVSLAGATGALVKTVSRGAQFGTKIPSEERLLKIITSSESRAQTGVGTKMNVKLGEIRDNDVLGSDPQIITYGIGTNDFSDNPQLFIIEANATVSRGATDPDFYEHVLEKNGLKQFSGHYNYSHKKTTVSLDRLRAQGMTDVQIASLLRKTIEDLEDLFLRKSQLKTYKSRKSL